jgi:hypothetical protein
MSELYKIDFPSGRSYIGITNYTAAERLRQHERCATVGDGHLLHRAMRKHVGAYSMKVLVSGSFDRELLALVEQEAIDKFRTKAPHGYNLTDGGDGVFGLVRTAEHCARVSKALTGMRQSQEVIDRMAATQRRRLADPAVRKNLSEKLTGKKASAETKRKQSEALRGREVSQETRDRISKSTMGRKCTEEHREAMSRGRARAKQFRAWKVVVSRAFIDALSEDALFSCVEGPR